MTELNLILLGPPGAGKGTQAERISEDFNLPYIATGDLLRAAVGQGSDLGRRAKEYMDRGELVPDDVVIGMILERVDGQEARDGFLLDGFPRTVTQAVALDEALGRLDRRLTAALYLDVPDEDVVRRLSGRRMNPRTGRVYHVELDPPREEGVDDEDGLPLVQRVDDQPETIRRRLEVYHQQTAPLVDFYEERGALRRVDGTRPATEVHDHLRATIATLKLEDEL